MTVETWYVEVGGEGIQVDGAGAANFGMNARPAAQTIVRFDGDSVGIIPVRKAESGDLEVHKELLTLHVQNVRTATEYRASILNSLVSILREYT
jgi:hypothetical protein